MNHNQTEQESAELLCRILETAIAKEAPAPQESPVTTINLTALFFRILENIKYVILCAILLAMLGGCYAQYCVIPSYSATAKLYILGQPGATSNLNSLQVGTVLTMDYQEVFKTWEVHEMVQQELGLDYSYSQLQSMLTVTNPDDTRLLYITVTCPNAQMAADIANAYAKSAKTFILDTMDGEAPSSFSLALPPSVSNSMGKGTYISLGFLLGALLSVMIIVLHFVFDDRPRGPEDVAEICGLPTFAVIPAMKSGRLFPEQNKE